MATLGVVQKFSGHLVIGSGQGGAEAEDFAGDSHMQRQALAGFGTDREFGAPFAQNEHTASRLPFAEQYRVSRTSDFGFHLIERGQHSGRQIAKNPVRTQGAFEAVLLYRALHKWLIPLGREKHSDCSHPDG